MYSANVENKYQVGIGRKADYFPVKYRPNIMVCDVMILYVQLYPHTEKCPLQFVRVLAITFFRKEETF